MRTIHGVGSSTSIINNTNNIDNSTTNNIDNSTNNLNFNLTFALPNERNRENVDHLVSLTFRELKKLLGLAPNAETIANMFAQIHTRADVPQGIGRGVSPHGELLVDTPAGIVAVASGEVSVRPDGAHGRPRALMRSAAC